MVIFYLGLYCSLCKRCLAQLEGLQAHFHEAGVDVVIASADPEEKALAMVDEVELSLPTGYGLSVDQITALGLYASDPRSPQ